MNYQKCVLNFGVASALPILNLRAPRKPPEVLRLLGRLPEVSSKHNLPVAAGGNR